jgi:predicted  nucleic acid-binding Zn-ribbon protein
MLKRLNSNPRRKRKKRNGIVRGRSSGDVRSRYESIQRGRPGFVAVVPMNAMVCGGCRTGLTPNLVNQVMKGKEIMTL